METSDKIHQVLGNLDTRSQDIIRSRWLDDNKATLKILLRNIRFLLNASVSWNKNAMKKLRTAIEAAA